MTSRDERASYYDIELPDGTRTEVWAVLRAVLSPEEALGYVKACILARIMRDGRKDVDRMREAEKVGIEAGMLREAMEAHLATPDPVTAALDAVDMADPMETATVRTLARLCHEAGIEIKFSIDDANPAARIAELERERDEARAQTTELERALDALRQTLVTERQAAVATAEELERVRRELADLQDRYRPRRQSEEPAPDGAPIMRWNATTMRWQPSYGYELRPDHTWTHQPPAPGEGE